MQTVLASVHASLLLLNDSPTEWPAETFSKIDGVLSLRLRESLFVQEGEDFAELGHRVADALNHASGTGLPIDATAFELHQRDLSPTPIAPARAPRLLPSSPYLERALELVKRKEAIQSEILDIDRKVEKLMRPRIPSPVLGPKRRTRQRRRREPMIGILLAKLEEAGERGISVKELALRTGRTPTSIATWIYTTGKIIPGVRKVRKGRFTYTPERTSSPSNQPEVGIGPSETGPQTESTDVVPPTSVSQLEQSLQGVP